MTATSDLLRVDALVHLAPPRHCAGAEMMLFCMLSALVERGHDVHAWVSYDTPDSAPYTFGGVTVHPRSDEDEPDWAASDVVVSHLENVPAAATAALRHGKPFVNVVHNTHAATKMLLAGKTDLIVYNSEWMADALGRRDNAIIVRPPVLTEDYRTHPGSKVTLVNLNENKGGRLFWELAESMPGVQFLGVKGAYGEQIVRDLPNVEVLEHGGDMRAVYGASWLVLMPSAYESWGRVGVEAMASGIPVIAHPTPGLLESLGFAGTFCDRADLRSWQDAIDDLLQPDVWLGKSRAALARSRELDPTAELAAWCDAVERLVSA